VQFTLYITHQCNLRCRYCGQHKGNIHMSADTAFAAIDLALEYGGSAVGIGLYGGEPLLCRERIAELIGYAHAHKAQGQKLYFKITTNGTLLDADFIAFAKRAGIIISLSLDGTQVAHDRNRMNAAEEGSYEKAVAHAPALLAANPYTACMMTLSPNNLAVYADSVRHIYALGFQNLVVSPDYSATWTDADLAELEKQYDTLADWYCAETRAERKFFFSPIDSKINSRVNRRTFCKERCKLGYEQICIDTDGKLYPCTQFVGNLAYCIGDLEHGINESRRMEVYSESRGAHPLCKKCALKDRCLQSCRCINMASTGDPISPSPLLCAHERILIAAADRAASTLFAERSGMFIQKHYNKHYPLVSLVAETDSIPRIS